MKVRLDQIIGTKEAVRSLPKLIERLNAGEGPFILTRRNKPVAMLSRLPDDAKGTE